MRKINKKLLKKKILFCSAEAAPLAKAGGLADVVGSLPLALKGQNIEARILMPAHGPIALRVIKAKKLFAFAVLIDGQKEKVTLYQAKVQGIYYYLLQNKHYFSGAVYEGDNIKKYLFFSRAALTVLKHLPFHPDIIHAHDFHASPIITEISTEPRKKRPGLVLTIHNLQHQGWVEKSTLLAFGFNPLAFTVGVSSPNDNWCRLLAAGIKSADKITTVSPSYAREILTPAYGHGLDPLLLTRSLDLVGILNGIDTVVYNPADDHNLAQSLSENTWRSDKAVNKSAIRNYLGLADDASPLFIFIARFSQQKGLDLLQIKRWQALANKYSFQLVLLGTGGEKYEKLVLDLARALPLQARALIVFSEVLAHNLYAAADYFLMPSAFEPCGLTQMIAMRYGAVPIVRGTGGLKDTVINNKTGLVFQKYSAASLFATLARSLRLYYKDNQNFRAMQKMGRQQDWSWAASAPKYRQLYDKV